MAASVAQGIGLLFFLGCFDLGPPPLQVALSFLVHSCYENSYITEQGIPNQAQMQRLLIDCQRSALCSHLCTVVRHGSIPNEYYGNGLTRVLYISHQVDASSRILCAMCFAELRYEVQENRRSRVEAVRP